MRWRRKAPLITTVHLAQCRQLLPGAAQIAAAVEVRGLGACVDGDAGGLLDTREAEDMGVAQPGHRGNPGPALIEAAVQPLAMHPGEQHATLWLAQQRADMQTR